MKTSPEERKNFFSSGVFRLKRLFEYKFPECKIQKTKPTQDDFHIPAYKTREHPSLIFKQKLKDENLSNLLKKIMIPTVGILGKKNRRCTN